VITYTSGNKGHVFNSDLKGENKYHDSNYPNASILAISKNQLFMNLE